MILEDIKTLLAIPSTDDSNDALIAIYIRKSVMVITQYLNQKETIDISMTYQDAVIEYVIICMKRKGNEGIKQSSQGSRSETYENDIPTSVKSLLPLPCIRFVR